MHGQLDGRLLPDAGRGSCDDDDLALEPPLRGLGAPADAHRQLFVQPEDESDSGDFQKSFWNPDQDRDHDVLHRIIMNEKCPDKKK